MITDRENSLFTTHKVMQNDIEHLLYIIDTMQRTPIPAQIDFDIATGVVLNLKRMLSIYHTVALRPSISNRVIIDQV